MKIYIITSFPLSIMKEFAHRYHLGEYTNVTMAQGSDLDFVNYFGVTRVPYIAIYDRDKILKQVMIGKVSVAQLTNNIQE